MLGCWLILNKMRKIKQWSTTRSCVAPLKLNEMAEIKIAVSMFGKMVKLQWLNYYLYKLRNWLTFTFLAVLNLKFILTHSNLKILIKAALIFFFLITFWRLLWNALVLFTFCRVYPYIRYLWQSGLQFTAWTLVKNCISDISESESGKYITLC